MDAASRRRHSTPVMQEKNLMKVVTLWKTNIAGWNITIGNTSSKGPLSIAMLVYQSVVVGVSWLKH